MKKCSCCKQTKKIEDFGPNKNSKDGKQYRCNKCFSEAMKIHYSKNSKQIKQRMKILEEEITNEFNQIKQKLGCKFCLEKEPACLDFHHLDKSLKEENVSFWVHAKSKNKALEEAKKCIVVCANCHRKIHAGLIDWVASFNGEAPGS